MCHGRAADCRRGEWGAGLGSVRCERLCAEVSLLFPLRGGEVIVLRRPHGLADGRGAVRQALFEDAFFVARDAAHRRLARACARAVRAGVLIRSRTRATRPRTWRGFIRGGRGWRGVGFLCVALVLVSHEAVFTEKRPSRSPAVCRTCGGGAPATLTFVADLSVFRARTHCCCPTPWCCRGTAVAAYLGRAVWQRLRHGRMLSRPRAA